MKPLWPAVLAALLLTTQPADAQFTDSQRTDSQQTDAQSLLQRYEAGVADAAVVEESERADDLVPITADNDTLVWNADRSQIKVVTWKAQGAFDRFLKPFTATSDSEDYVVWVTAAPQMQQRCQRFRQAHPDADKAEVDLFLKQFLGLHPDWTYDVFVELWVAPDALFRPCVDPEADDRTCEANFAEPVARVKGLGDYRSFYEGLYFKSFRSPPGVPWTGLGYTYNWGDAANEQGASEFILSPGTAYTIAGAIPTMTYCRPD